ncbi:MAG: polysulfide reductase NrfD [Gemmatimonadota bacterium]|nr:polysulfide reductase NrfD [Gemmatimonadota bacterium]
MTTPYTSTSSSYSRSVIRRFIWDSVATATHGSRRYHIWMAVLTFFMVLGSYAYSVQLRQGLSATGMSDAVSWGLYISNFTFLVGIAAAAVMLVLPTYILKDVDFGKSVLLGEGMAVSAVLMCMAFVTVDLGGPARIWHMIPFIGRFNWPRSMLAWDVVVLSGYLVLNLSIPAYILFKHYKNEIADPKRYVPWVMLSVFWAVSIHLVTAFLYSGLSARPFWHNALLGPRFLASAFAAGPALMILAFGAISRFGNYRIENITVRKIALIVTVAAQINLIMLGSEIFKEFYSPTHHSAGAVYLFFGLDGHSSLVPWMWTSILLNIGATIVLTVHSLRQQTKWLYAACAVLFVAIWIDKGIGLIIPGFVPGPWSKITDYTPTLVEIFVTVGIWAMGCFVFTVLAKVAVAIESGRLRQSW